MAILTRRFLVSLACIAGGLILFSSPPCRAALTHLPASGTEDFPVYRVIEPNVNFWIDIFTRYGKSDGVIHDSRDLSRIYGTVELNPINSRRAAKQNRKKKDKAIKTYKAILLKLAQGRPPSTAAEERVAAMFGDAPSPEAFKQAAYRLRIQTGLKKQFEEGIIRSGALLDEFKRIFRSHGLPEDLVYLPCVESSFNVAAYSKFGAAGIWQFTRSTGKLYMEIGYVVDERRDPFIATQSAARLLKKNFSHLKEWPMAITAYNHGLNGMKKKKKKHKTYPRIYTRYRSRSFKFASRNFYSEFLAARHVAKHYTRYFGKLRLDRPTETRQFKAEGYIPAIDLARELDLDLDVFKQLNPALRKPVFDGRKYIPKGYELRLPIEVPPDAVARAAKAMYRGRQKPSKFHRVRKGDTAGSIARTHRVPLKDLILANGLGRRATIYIGQTLRIPGRDEAPKIKTALAKAPAPVSPKPEPVDAPVPETASVKEADTVTASVSKERRPAPPPPVPDLHPSELYPVPPRYAERHAKPVETDSKVNLKIVTADLKIQVKTGQKGERTGLIHVAPEETLGHYADWLGIATRELRKLNRLPFGRSITIGQAIKIPIPASGSGRFEERRYEFHQEILEDFFDSFFVAGVRNYTVKSGDTLWDLCMNELEIPMWLLEKYNPAMDLKSLHPGQTIVYPAVNPNGIHPAGSGISS